MNEKLFIISGQKYHFCFKIEYPLMFLKAFYPFPYHSWIKPKQKLSFINHQSKKVTKTFKFNILVFYISKSIVKVSKFYPRFIYIKVIKN